MLYVCLVNTADCSIVIAVIRSGENINFICNLAFFQHETMHPHAYHYDPSGLFHSHLFYTKNLFEIFIYTALVISWIQFHVD